MKNNKSVIDKLTALWALNESGLGGFMHIFNSPFTGLIVGGIAILLISLIAFYAENKWKAILKALAIVLIIKLAVSPYSPLHNSINYLAAGKPAAFLFSNFSWKGMTLIVLGIVTYLQSALMKLLKLTIVYGTEFWEALNIYGSWIQTKMNYIIESSTTSVIISIYIIIYLFCGILAGYFIKSIIKIISKKEQKPFYLHANEMNSNTKKSKQQLQFKLIWIWLFTMALIVLAFTYFGGNLIGWKKAIYIIFRSFFVLLIWYLVLGPLVLKLIQFYLNKKESQYQNDISKAMDLFPYFRIILRQTWRDTNNLKGYSRFKYFIANSISNCIHLKVVSK